LLSQKFITIPLVCVVDPDCIKPNIGYKGIYMVK